jgi:putative redox protein
MIESRKVSFPGSAAGNLAARLDLPSKPRAFALFAHCFTCGKDILAASRIAAGLAARGIAVLRFDFTGIGSSEGEFANTNFSSNVADLVAAADYLRRSHAAPCLLIGHSLGGAAVLAAAAQVPEAAGIVTIGAPSSAAHITRQFAADVGEILQKGSAEVSLAGRKFTIARQFLDDVGEQNFLDRLPNLGKALLVCHGPRDEIVGIDNAGAIFAAARHPKSFLSLDTADHLVSKREDAAYLADVIAAWASRYLPGAEEASALPPGVVEVTEARTARLAQYVRAGRHLLMADEPIAAGGDDIGPGPYDYLLAALGACTSMTMRLYAERKGIPAERFSVRLSHRKLHAVDCADCETREGRIDEITREISIEGDLPDAARDRLMEIADKCPVHQTLTHEVKIRSRLVAPESRAEP